MVDLKNEVLEPVYKRIKSRADSLEVFREPRFKNKKFGIEGWLKVETVSALPNMVEEIKNEGADLTLSGGEKIELKGMTDFNPKYIRKGVTKYKYHCDCLFLADGSDESEIRKLGDDEDDEVTLVDYKIFSANDSCISGRFLRKNLSRFLQHLFSFIPLQGNSGAHKCDSKWVIGIISPREP